MKTAKVICPQCCNHKDEKKDFYYNKLGQKVYVECRSCVIENNRKKRQQKRLERQFCY